MSVRVGNPVQVTLASQSLGQTSGRVFSFNNPGWGMLLSATLTYTASATGGSRVPVVDIKDGSGNLIWRGVIPSGNITTTQAARINIGAGLSTATITTPPTINIASPDGLGIPPAATLTVFDNANIDSADTVAGNIVYST